MANIARDLGSVVHTQLPATLRDKLSISFEGDPYGMRVTAVFTAEDKRVWKSDLEDMTFEGVPLRCKVPDTFVAHLCVAV